MPVSPLNPYDTLPEVPSFTLASVELTDGARMADGQVHDSAGGGNVSPSLSWSGAPEGTQGYAVTCFDADAPTGCGFWHWILTGLDASVTSLPAGFGAAGADHPKGAVTLRNDFGDFHYDGAAPPPGHGDHRYFFAVHALDTADLGVDEGASAAVGSFMTVAHTIARATLTVTWSR